MKTIIRRIMKFFHKEEALEEQIKKEKALFVFYQNL